MQITTARTAYIPVSFRCNDVSFITSKQASAAGHKTPAQSMQSQLRFENKMKTDVWVCYRNGLYVRVRGTIGICRDNTLLAYKEFLYTKDTSNNSMDFLDSFGVLTDDATPETKATQESFVWETNYANTNNNYNCKSTIVYKITEEDIGGHPNGVYIEELDVVLSLTNCFTNTLHPFSEAGRRFRSIVNEKENQEKESVLNYSLRIVDHSNRYGKRFIRLGDEVFEVPVSLDTTLEEGVYIGGHAPLEQNKNTKLRRRTLTVEQADNIGLFFKTIEQAQRGPDETIKVQELNIAQETISLKKEQLQFQRDELVQKSEELRIRREQEADRFKADNYRLFEDRKRREADIQFKLEMDHRQLTQVKRGNYIDIAKSVVTFTTIVVSLVKLGKG